MSPRRPTSAPSGLYIAPPGSGSRIILPANRTDFMVVQGTELQQYFVTRNAMPAGH